MLETSNTTLYLFIRMRNRSINVRLTCGTLHLEQYRLALTISLPLKTTMNLAKTYPLTTRIEMVTNAIILKKFPRSCTRLFILLVIAIVLMFFITLGIAR